MDAHDLGPEISHQHGDAVVESFSDGAERAQRARRRSPFALDGYRTRGQLAPDNPRLNEARFDAGDRLRADFDRSGLEGRVSARYAESVGSCHGTPQDHVASLRMDAYARFQAAFRSVRYELRDVLWSVVLAGESCGRVRMDGLRQALDDLRRHYGIK